ncbi:MAG: TonB-dependent receptor [Novosphingobium sp.]|nr:TonB-dependent receptor [Novosphingobium sp.]
MAKLHDLNGNPRRAAMALALVVALAAFQVARAEEAGAIVVTGTGLAAPPAAPAYSHVELDRDDLRAAASGRIEDVLLSVAGFQQFRRSDSRSANPSAQGVTLRALGGNATSRALVLLDGVPMSDPFFGYVPLSALAPERLARVRVTRGGGTGSFGAGAIAGAIELTSADAAALGPLSAGLAGNQRGESELWGSIAGQAGQGFAVLSGRWERGRGFWTTPASQRSAASARARYEAWSLSLRGVARLADDVELQARVAAFDDRRVLRFAGADSGSSGQDASLRLVGRGPWQFEALAYVQARDFSNVVVSATSFRKTLDQRRTPSTGLGGKLELRPPVGGGHVLRAGGDWRLASGELQEEPYSAVTGLETARRRAGGRNADIGLYLEDDWELGALVLTGGVRADRWTFRNGRYREVTPAGAVTADLRFPARSGWETSWRGGLLWRGPGGVSLRAAAYGGLRLPTLNELYRPFVVFPVTTQANAGLRAERLAGYEAGVDFRPSDAVRFSLTGFDNRVRHAIANVTIGPALRERRNIRAVAARGVEADAELRAGAWAFDASLAWTRARMRAGGVSAMLHGMRPAQTPALAASARISWTPAPDARLTMTVRHTGMQFEDDLETDSLPAFSTLDGYAEVPLARGVSVILRGENLGNARIVTRNQGGSLDLGAPRTIWAGLRFTSR